MAKKIILTLIFLIVLLSGSFAQWPGYFYAFELKDEDGNTIDSLNKNYKLMAYPCEECSWIITGVSMCEGNKTWHFYAGGNGDLYKTNILTIMRLDNSESLQEMTIEFPPTLSRGREKYYRDLYIGEVKFKPGKYAVKLPETVDEWDNLPKLEEKICRLSYAKSVYYDISGFQK